MANSTSENVLVSVDLSKVDDADRKNFTKEMLARKFAQAESQSTWTSELPADVDPMIGLSGALADKIIEDVLQAADKCGIKNKIVGDVLVSPYPVRKFSGKQDT